MTEYGGNYSRKYLIKFNGQPYTSYDTKAQAEGYVRMQLGKATACPKKAETYAVKGTWTIEVQGG